MAQVPKCLLVSEAARVRFHGCSIGNFKIVFSLGHMVVGKNGARYNEKALLSIQKFRNNISANKTFAKINVY